MNEQIVQMLLFVLSYIIILVMGYLIINFLSAGFFNKFMIVKLSRGKKKLVKVIGLGDVYYTAGQIDETDLVFKDRLKAIRRFTKVQRNQIYKSIGVDCIDIDDEKNSIVNPQTNENVTGFDAIRQENLIVRALKSPKIDSKAELIQKITIVIMIAGFGFLIFKIMSIEQQLVSIETAVQALKSMGVVN